MVPHPPYQRNPGRRNAFDAPACPGARVGEAIARYLWRDHMEGVARIAAICCGVRQRRDNLVKLDHRSRPAMCDQERKRIRFRRTNMTEMDVEPVQGCAILAEGVKHSSEERRVGKEWVSTFRHRG